MRKFNPYNHSRDMVSKMYAALCVTSESTRPASYDFTRETLKLYIGARAEMDNPHSSSAPRTWKTPAAIAFERARAIESANNRGIAFTWETDSDFEPGDTPDNASAINHCEYVHGGRHVKSRAVDSGFAGGRGHWHGELDSRCSFSAAERYDASACIAYLLCDVHAEWETGRPNECQDGCEVLASLCGIQESRDFHEQSRYRREVEADLAHEALTILDERALSAAALSTCRARGVEYIGRGV
jgi:hypothetical protein